MTDDREHQIRERAHAKWEKEGRPEGRALDHWLNAESETEGRRGRSSSIAHPDDVDDAAGPSHGNKDFGGHDAEAEGSAESGVGGQHFEPGASPKQAPSDKPEVGEERVSTGQPKR
ncbi:DUF2934 domain-containing protein [Sphingomonas sp. CGMCC 1.13654]|uniref:DUF2934 domain-containing protein n=1 Tax=Sphingomonas chungangi TaxID=2683589 RepID=A0A838LA29_9SPHN|nr:DUF2934 domain-containing protein [Sphingomonas chungangi]MBA2934358.1 DUF2934 domain-containing protein [Sphingomonas chungangi]MVW57397.1 DUF2934 domain-containing protein [Sphingomonas chungangi]